jgi:hypothetical protein
MNLLSLIIDHILGRRYYANIVYHIGTRNCEIASHIFETKKDARIHRESLVSNRSFNFIKTISFRSRTKITNIQPYV